MNRLSKITSILVGITLVLSVTFVFADIGAYKIDLEPQNLFNLSGDTPPPTQVNVYVTGPTTGHDKIATSILYSKFIPQYSTTNYLEISNLVAILSHEDITERITNDLSHEGYTSHLLLFQNANKTVMHFRIFKPSDIKTDWYDVWPKSSTSFGYFNQEIGLWLQTRVNENSNSLRIAK